MKTKDESAQSIVTILAPLKRKIHDIIYNCNEFEKNKAAILAELIEIEIEINKAKKLLYGVSENDRQMPSMSM
jgi:hypothetical protein